MQQWFINYSISPKNESCCNRFEERSKERIGLNGREMCNVEERIGLNGRDM